jgi:predicted TIM-barrel fold metal-dependent hydrolase
MDYEYTEETSFHMKMRLKPSDYFHENGFVTFERDSIGVKLLEVIGEDNVMWGSDYPHPDGTWPDSQKFLDADFRDIPERVRRKVVHDNAARLYHLGAGASL